MFIVIAAMYPQPFPLQQQQKVDNQPPHPQQAQEEGQQQTMITSDLLLCQQPEEEESSAAVEETALSVAESSSILTSAAPLQIQKILDHNLDTTATVAAVSLSQPLSPQDNHGESAAAIAASSIVQQHQQFLFQKDTDVDDVSASSPKEQQQQQQQQRIMFDEASVEVCVEESLQQQRQQSGAVGVLMCKSNLLSFNFETSLIRDERKLTAIIKSLPEYVDTKSEIELEYQGESIEGIFSAADKHHIRGQPIIDDINSNRLMRGLVYYVRELILSEDEDERETKIILCWTDVAASKSEIFLERVLIDEYLHLLEDGYVLHYYCQCCS